MKQGSQGRGLASERRNVNEAGGKSKRTVHGGKGRSELDLAGTTLRMPRGANKDESGVILGAGGRRWGRGEARQVVEAHDGVGAILGLLRSAQGGVQMLRCGFPPPR